MQKYSAFLFFLDFEMGEILLHLNEPLDDFLGVIFDLDEFGYIFLFLALLLTCSYSIQLASHS